MATVYVDNKPCEMNAEENLLHGCLSHGFKLPYFCWHPALGSVGACRQCAVKQFKDEKDTHGKIVMSCMTPAAEGTRISIADPEAAHRQAGRIGAGTIEGALAERDEPAAHQRHDAKRHQSLGEGQSGDENQPVRQHDVTGKRQRRERNRGRGERADDASHLDLPRRRALEQALGPKRQHQRHDQIDDEELRPRHKMNGSGAGEADGRGESAGADGRRHEARD